MQQFSQLSFMNLASWDDVIKRNRIEEEREMGGYNVHELRLNLHNTTTSPCLSLPRSIDAAWNILGS